MKVCVLSVKEYDFINGDQRVQGGKVSYLINDKDVDGVKGYSPLILNVDSEMCTSFKDVPGIYDLDFTMKTGKNNKPELVLKGVSLINSIDLGNMIFKTNVSK